MFVGVVGAGSDCVGGCLVSFSCVIVCEWVCGAVYCVFGALCDGLMVKSVEYVGEMGLSVCWSVVKCVIVCNV